MRADRERPRSAGLAGRAALGHERARPPPPTAQADGVAALEAAVADVWFGAAGADGDAPHPPAAALGPVGAAGADGMALLVARGNGFDHPTADAGSGELTAPAAGAHPAGA